MIRLLKQAYIRISLLWSGLAVASAEQAEDDPNSIRYVLGSAVEDAKPRCLISVLGTPPRDIGEVLESVAFVCRRNREFPVAVMTELPPGLIAASTMPIEFLPTRDHLPVRPDEYERHIRRRWSLMIAKWQFAKQIELSIDLETFLAQQLQGAEPTAPALRQRVADYALATEA